jgi:hypothetical protein
LAALSVNNMWNFCTIFLVWNIDVGHICILYRKLCIAEVESVEAEGVIRLTGGRPPGRQPSWTTGDGLGITERTTTVLHIWGIDRLLWCHSRFFYVVNGRKINSLSGNVSTKIIIPCFKKIVRRKMRVLAFLTSSKIFPTSFSKKSTYLRKKSPPYDKILIKFK